jgi:hypothetical protein
MKPEGRRQGNDRHPTNRLALALCRLIDPATGTCATGEICRRCRQDSAAVLRAAVNFSEYLHDSQDGKAAVVRVADLEAWATELEGHHG